MKRNGIVLTVIILSVFTGIIIKINVSNEIIGDVLLGCLCLVAIIAGGFADDNKLGKKINK